MADGTESRVNLAALRRVDPYATEILETGSQVAVYKYACAQSGVPWEKTDIEGSLFLYNRSGDPCHGFVVMNRLSTENFVQPVTKDMEIQLQTPFLLYRHAKGEIMGIWFFEESECKRFAEHLEVFIKGEAARHRNPQPGVMTPSRVDIMSMLSKAQGEYEQKQGKTAESGKGRGEAPIVRQDVSNGLTSAVPLSVADLFGTPAPKTTVEHTIQNVSVLDKLLSSVVPAQPIPLPTELPTAQSLEREIREKLKTGTPTSSDKILSHSTPVAKTTSVSQQIGAFHAAHKTPDPDAFQGMAFTPPKTGSSLPLMSPMMFASAVEMREETSVIATPKSSFTRTFPTASDHTSVPGEITPLTKAQLIQAFNHLLKTDPSFITRLHEAYVDSLKLSLKTGQ